MSEEKLCSDEVPEKFTEWLLTMGCPLEKVPADKISQMCRGQYYMVWRSLMEHVYPKDIIKQKRLQVFCDDVKNSTKKYVYSKKDTPTVPEEVLLWRQQTELKTKVAEAEQRVNAGRQNLQELMNKISSKVAQRNISRKRWENLQRRAWLLTQVKEELKTKHANLQEIKTIAESLCTVHNDDTDVKGKLDKFLSSLERTSPQRNMNASMFTNDSASRQPDGNDEEHLSSLLKCSSEAVWAELLERRKALASKLAEYNAQPVVKQCNTSVTPQSVLSNTIALQCTLALEAMKNRAHTQNARNKLASALTELNIHQSDACELLVLQSELAEATARTEALKSTCEDLVAGTGVFEVTGENIEEPKKVLSASVMENKKEELKRLVSSLTITERKIQNVRDNLLTVFNAFYKDSPMTEMEKYKGVQLDLPLESIPSLKKFYEDRSEKKSKKMELSLNFDVSSISFNDNTDFVNLSFAEELRMYMKNFNLENNRKLVLESGDQIWISETLSSSLERYYNRLQKDGIESALMSPTQSITNNLRELLNELQTKADLEKTVNTTVANENKIEFKLDINIMKQEEEQFIDKIKKNLSEDIQKLHNTDKLLDKGEKNLKFWVDNVAKNYISTERRVDGQTYKTVEALYIDSLC